MGDGALRIRLLGGFEIAGDAAVPESAWRLRRAKSLVKLLALAPDRRMHREQVAEVLWPDRDPASAANNLRQALFTARRALDAAGGEGSRCLSVRDGLLTLAGVEIDVDVFEEAAAEARAQPTVPACERAVALYGGELLPEDRYEEWTAARREVLRERHLWLLVTLAELHEAAGDGAAAIEALQRAVVEDPLHEAAHRELMRLFAAAGRQQQALAQYQQLRDALRRELAADPDPETRRVHRELLAGSVESPTAATGGSNLPHRVTSFVGRRRELAELTAMLDRTRLLTLVGPGGCGKTRLALELADGRVEDFAGGVRLVELASISDPELVVQQVATAIGAQLQGRRDPVEVLAEQIGERPMLLVLDNCEHVVGECARVVNALLAACPALEVLATSREPLRVQGEVLWRVPSLSLPDPASVLDADELAGFEAVRLFVERAGAVAPGFALDADSAGPIASICLRLDGMPLALELAAARAAVLAPAQIAERLHDSLGLLTAGSRGLSRQETLRATLEWSHDLLEEPERVLFRRLGVFAGSFGIDAVEGVCAGDGIAAGDALSLLGLLVEKSLVQVEPVGAEHRYRLLETMRQYARELLGGAGELRAFEARHRAWYLALAEAEDPTPTGGRGDAARVERDHDNLRAALASALDHEPEEAILLALAMWWFWVVRGYFREGSRWVDAALARYPEQTELRARALAAAALLEVRRGLFERRIALVEEAVEIRRAVGDATALACGLQELGDHLVLNSQHDAAERTFAEGLELCAGLDDVGQAAGIKQSLGVVTHYRGDLAGAHERFRESIELLDGATDERVVPFWAVGIAIAVAPDGPGGAPRGYFEASSLQARTVGRRSGIAYALCNAAITRRRAGEYAAAIQGLERALAIFRDADDDEGAALALQCLGGVMRSADELDRGRDCLEEALALREAIGNRRDIGATIGSLGLLAMRAGEHDHGRALLGDAWALFERTEDGPALSGTMQNLGSAELDYGDPALAADLLGRAAAMWGEQTTIWNRSWNQVMRVEAALAAGQPDIARAAAADARAAFEHLGDVLGLARVAELERDVDDALTPR
jgi:predicted ATPase/DNA-binding SARP family transcriptional activator